MAKIVKAITIDADLFEAIKQKNVNFSGLIDTLIREWLAKQEANKPTTQIINDITERIQYCAAQFATDDFEIFKKQLEYSKKLIWQGLKNRGYTDDEIQKGYEIAYANYLAWLKSIEGV